MAPGHWQVGCQVSLSGYLPVSSLVVAMLLIFDAI
jgi:hypothetical protein